VEGGKEAMRAGIYTRVSTDNQEQEGTSIQTQLEACLKYCQNKGYEVAYRFSEAYSGLTLERPKLNELRELVRAGEVDVIVVYCLDRLSRDPTHGVILQEELEKHNVSLEAVTETVDSSELGKLISYIRGFASKLEAEKIRERTMRGKKARAKEGYIVSNSHARLYGYSYVPVSQENGGRRVVNEDEAKWVRQMYQWLVNEGLSTNAITYRLRSLNVPTPSGKGFWIKSTVRSILANVAYTGKTYAFTCTYGEPASRRKPDTKRKLSRVIRKPKDEWLEIPGVTPAIISQDMFEAAQNQLQINCQNAKRNTKQDYLLQGHVHCRQCGRRFRGRFQRVQRKNKLAEVRRYQCAGTQKIVTPVNRCINKSWKADDLEALVWEQIERVLDNPELIIAEVEKQRQDVDKEGVLEAELRQVERQLRVLDREQKELLDNALRGFPESLIISENKKINGKRGSLTVQKAELETKINASQEAAISLPKLECFIELLRQKLTMLDYDTKRMAFDMLGIKVWLDGHNVEVTGVIPVMDDAIATTPCSWQSRGASTPLHTPQRRTALPGRSGG
jgi:site-specific DNA recombinase